MKIKMLIRLLYAFITPIVLFSCTKDCLNKFDPDEHEDDCKTYYGPKVNMGNGTVRSFIIICENGIPKEVGLELTNDALVGLPDKGENSFLVLLHDKAKATTPFDHLEIDWNPHGHPPPHVYDVPHFDFHFYEISVSIQKAIPAYTPSTAALFDKAPPTGYLPDSYFPFPGGVPQMGKHWADKNAPELDPVNPSPFSATFIYGTYNGHVTFYEPMVTMDLIQSGETFSTEFPQPIHFSPNNTFYPTKYNIYVSNDKHYITLSEFIKH